MGGLPAWAAAAAGFVIGAACGFFVRRARLCTFGATESALIGGDWRAMKAFGLALGLALVGAQTLILAGFLVPAGTTYVAERLPVLSIALGSILFGLGMSLVGTCAFGSLTRLGGGDLRSLVVMLTFGAVAFATLRGAIADLRVALESASLSLAPHTPSALPETLRAWTGLDLRVALTLAAGGGLLAVAAADRRLRAMPRMLTAAAVLGLAVILGWIVTVSLDDFDAARRIQSLTFVSPVARTLYAGLMSAAAWADFGVASVVGVALGAFLAARRAGEFRWEAFDDAYEMRRHLLGAVLMGFGGVLAGGCTIGQGLTAGSLMALSWPLALAGMALGARLGIAVLVEGSLRDVLAGRLARWRDRA
ncbi:MAG: YeeE/YedE family protein [Methylobacteriaceae bacterium]|nr:YeeE/YedE family protein [Methylobacteriaceae bacterium]